MSTPHEMACCLKAVFFLTSSNFWLIFNSLGPSDAIWRWGSWSTLVQVMACCLTAPSHYQNQCWLVNRVLLCYSLKDNSAGNVHESNHCNTYENYTFEINATYPRGQWVKITATSPIGQWVYVLLQCLWCGTGNGFCADYPVGDLIPRSSLCKLSDARWGTCNSKFGGYVNEVWLHVKITLLTHCSLLWFHMTAQI